MARETICFCLFPSGNYWVTIAMIGSVLVALLFLGFVENAKVDDFKLCGRPAGKGGCLWRFGRLFVRAKGRTTGGALPSVFTAPRLGVSRASPVRSKRGDSLCLEVRIISRWDI